MKEIKHFSNGCTLIYDNGNFDNWCVYLINKSGNRLALTDRFYFKMLKNISVKYSVSYIYTDFLCIYNLTKTNIESDVLKCIDILSSKYADMCDYVNMALTSLYATMVAEQNKKNTKLGKKIKLLGVYTLLCLNKDIDYSVNFMRGMSYKEILSLCEQYNLE